LALLNHKSDKQVHGPHREQVQKPTSRAAL
jgi:hypothetical protein